MELYPDDCTPTLKNNDSSQWVVFKHFQVCAIFDHAPHLGSPTGIWLACEFVLGDGFWSRNVDEWLIVMVKGMVNMVVWFWGQIRVEVDSYVICLVNIPEGIEGCFDVVHNGMAIVDQEEAMTGVSTGQVKVSSQLRIQTRLWCLCIQMIWSYGDSVGFISESISRTDRWGVVRVASLLLPIPNRSEVWSTNTDWHIWTDRSPVRSMDHSKYVPKKHYE